ncbi:MAG: alpha/beta fold hydrolase, partial [Microbacterium sp.]
MADTNTHRIRTVPVAGGDLTVCEWNPEATRTVVAIHGVTSTHVDWAYLGESVPQDLRVIAPDLRGRGRSAGLAGPWGMAQHARDVVSILDAFGIERGLLVGHSMGGFVAVLTAVEHRGRTSGLVLVDGGLPAVDANVDDDALTRAVLAEARERLEVVYPTVQAYVEAVGATDPIAVRRATYDLVPTAGGYRIAGDYAAIAA